MTEHDPIVAEILRHGDVLAQTGRSGVNGVLSADADANRLLVEDPFAFLVGVIVDYQMPAERAWSLPYKLKQRLGGWGPRYVATNPEEVNAAFKLPPKLHRFPTQTPRFVVAGARNLGHRPFTIPFERVVVCRRHAIAPASISYALGC